MTPGDSDEPLIYTAHQFGQQPLEILNAIERTGKPAFITRLGRFVAVITPLAPGEIESQALTEMARQIAHGDA